MTTKPTKYSQKDIQEASNASIIDIVESFGYKLKKTGRTYSYGKNQKLRVYPDSNSYYDFSKGQGGTPIHFVRRELDTTFNQALDYILKGNYSEVEHVEPVKEPFNYYFPNNSDTSIGKDYLINKRKLDPNLVDFLFEKQKIRMDKLNQIIFPWQKNNVIVGATVQGTTYDPEKYDRNYFKGIARNSESNFTYNITIGNPTKMYVFESPIDMLSYWSMHKDLKQVSLVSLNGSKEQAIFNTLVYLQESNCKISDIFICSDNDRVGQILFQKVDLGYENIEFHKEIPDDLMIPQKCLDLYKEVLAESKSSMPIELIAAIHKFETNLSNTNECTSKEDLVFYLGKKLNPDEKPSEYSFDEMKERVEKLVNDLEKNRSSEGFDYKKTLKDRLKETQPNKSLKESDLLRIENYFKKFYELDELLVGTPVKDWNEKLQQQVELEEQKQTNFQSVAKGKIENSSLSKNDLIDRTFINKERQQQIRMFGTEETVKADIFQTGQYAGSLEPSNPEEMQKLIESYGFMAIDKEDYKKYTNEAIQKNSTNQEIEYLAE